MLSHTDPVNLDNSEFCTWIKQTIILFVSKIEKLSTGAHQSEWNKLELQKGCQALEWAEQGSGGITILGTVQKNVWMCHFGTWLSGGLDSSVSMADLRVFCNIKYFMVLGLEEDMHVFYNICKLKLAWTGEFNQLSPRGQKIYHLTYFCQS